MKLAYTIAALAFTAAVGGLGMTVPANAQPAPQGRYCDHTLPSFGADSCYHSMAQCSYFARPLDGSCTVNQHAALRPERDGHGTMARG
jgi:hypothetical protein